MKRHWVSVDVEVDVDDILESLSSDELAEIAKANGYTPIGDGDVSLRENTIERAYLAVRRMAEIPREAADLFWHVHGRAL